MKKLGKVMKIIGLVLVGMIIFVIGKIVIDQRIQAEDQSRMIKTDAELLGTHMYIERESEAPVDVNWYGDDERKPLVVQLHGGAFVAGDADTLDTLSDRMAENWNVHVATINYSLLKDGMTKEAVVREIVDTVKYFRARHEEYHINPDEIYILGYSAGGYYAMASTLQLHVQGITIKGQILCYAFNSDILDLYDALSEEQKQTMPKAFFVLADNDPLSNASLDYEAVLKEHGVETYVQKFDGTTHGFIEENNPEYEKLHRKNRSSKSAMQEEKAREAESAIGEWIGNEKNH